MLTTCAAASVSVDAQILLVDLHIHVLLDIRHHIQRNKGSLSFSLGIEGGNTHQSVHTLLRLQIAIGIQSIDLKSHRLDTGLVTVQVIQHLQLKPLALRPSGIHTIQHTAPVTALRAACSCIQLQNSIVFIIFL